MTYNLHTDIVILNSTFVKMCSGPKNGYVLFWEVFGHEHDCMTYTGSHHVSKISPQYLRVVPLELVRLCIKKGC